MAINAVPKRELCGYRVLVVEDDYFIANDVQASLEDLGCDILGPFPSVEEPMAAIEAGSPDAAVLDVNLSSGAVYPLARVLLNRKVPVLFVTGYDPKAINPQFKAVPRLVKPIHPRQLQKAISDLIQETRVTQDQTRGE